MTKNHESLASEMESYGVTVDMMRLISSWDGLLKSAIDHTPVDEPFGTENIVFELTGMKVGRFAEEAEDDSYFADDLNLMPALELAIMTTPGAKGTVDDAYLEELKVGLSRQPAYETIAPQRELVSVRCLA